MKPLTQTVNMNKAELKAWLADPRYMLASIDTGHESLRRLTKGDHYEDAAFARKVDNFNTRHGLSSHLFGQEVGNSGWSKRAIALRNWGHDPSKPSSPLFDADLEWLEEHPGAKKRRSGRVKNPIVISGVEGPAHLVEDYVQAAPFFSGDADRQIRPKLVSRGIYRVEYVPDCDLCAGMSAVVPVRDSSINLGVLRQQNVESPYTRAVADDYVSDMLGRIDRSGVMRGSDAACLCQLEPAITAGVCRQYKDLSREPNPPLINWILPVAQLLVSASGLFYSLSDLASVTKGGDPENVGTAVVHKNR